MSLINIDGVNLYYEVKGNPEAKNTIAFFNGVMASTSSWDFIVPIFEKFDFKIVLHDFKGQLKSDKPSGPYTFEQHCQEAKALFDHLEIEQVHLIGTSYGSEVAMKYALLYPDMVQSLVVIDGVSELDEVLKGFIDSWSYLLELKDGEKFFLGMAPSIYGNRFYENQHEMLKERAKALKKVDPSYFEGQRILYDTFIKEVNFTDELQNITAPTLVIVGEEDLLKRVKFSRIIAKNIPGSEFVILPNCGHVAIFESVQELQTLLLGFIFKHLKP